MNDMAHGPRGGVRIERDVTYGEGAVGFGTGGPDTRSLLMDVFLPGGVAPPGGRPALVLSHGGAYHRGAKERDEFEQGEDRNTPVHEYCERFAARGYVCFSIGYRLTQERPAPQPAPIKRDRDTVERFLETVLAPPRVTVAHLDAFAQAWNRHDIDALMSFMAEDCVFHASVGTEACGTRYLGRAAVRAGFMKAWADFPDAQWTRARHFVAGRRGVSEWTFVGTRASDGKRVEVDGGDLFTFQGDKIRVKDSWRKQRT